MINEKTLQINTILELDKEDSVLLPLTDKVIKLSEEIGELVESIQYFSLREQIEELYDSFNVCLVIMHGLKRDKLNIDMLSNIINKSEAKEPTFNNIAIYIGKINSALLIKTKSKISSKSSSEENLEKYILETMKEIVSFLKYYVEDEFMFEEIVNSKINKWKEKQSRD